MTPPEPSLTCSLVISGDSTTRPVMRSATTPRVVRALTSPPTLRCSARSSPPLRAISRGPRGSRPSRSGGATRPRSVWIPTTGTSWPPMSPSPRAVAVKPARPASARSLEMVWAEVSPECGLPTATSQFQPASRGSPMTCARLAPNTSAAMTAPRASAVPRTAERTGTAVRSLPGSNARRIPVTAGVGNPRRAIPRARREPRTRLAAVAPSCVQATRWAARAARAASRSMSRPAPPSSAGASNENPGEISARRARPTGVNTDSA
jgi:hypothetical protein